ncbi:hypothetical protein GQ600_8118 [Phytophthora cactorum]|nr:hypothetical protein GQ600_8118 [Phytophthora cactorum]
MPTPVRVHAKIEDISKASRTIVDVENATFTLQEGQGFNAFSTEIETRVADNLRRYKSKTVRPDTNVYIKPGQASRQRDFVPLSERNFTTMMSAANANHQSTKGAPKARGLLLLKCFGQVGEIAHTHWSLSHAPQPEGSELSVLDTATFAQAQHIDAMLVLEEVDEEPTYRTIAVRISGSSELPVTVDMVELRGVPGLPNHNLFASGVFSSCVPPQEPDEDVSDADHAANSHPNTFTANATRYAL